MDLEPGAPMKMITEYLQHALAFERLAADEQKPELKNEFEKQGAAYRRLAEERAKRLGLEPLSK